MVLACWLCGCVVVVWTGFVVVWTGFGVVSWTSWVRMSSLLCDERLGPCTRRIPCHACGCVACEIWILIVLPCFDIENIKILIYVKDAGNSVTQEAKALEYSKQKERKNASKKGP